MDRVVMEAWRGDGVGLCIEVHIVTVIAVVMQVRTTTVGTRMPQGMGVLVAMGSECKYTGGERWGHLLHGSHTAHIPLTDVLVEG